MTTTENELLLERILERPDTERISLKFLFIVPPILLYNISYGVFFYVINEWIQDSVQSQVFTNTTYHASSVCNRGDLNKHETDLFEHVESETAWWQMVNGLALQVPATVAAAILPAYTDCLGRRFILITSTTGCALKIAISTATIYFNLSPMFIVVGSVIDGLTGTYFSMSAGTISYVADLTEIGRQRSCAITVLEGLVLMTMMLSSLGTGYLIHWAGFFMPMVGSAGLTALALIFFIFFVPESYAKHARCKNMSLFAVIKRTFNFYVSDTFRVMRRVYLILMASYIFENMANTNRSSLEMLYQLGRPFCWSAEKIGMFSSIRHAVQGFAGVILIKPLQTYFSDINIAIASLTFGVGSYILEALASTDVVLYTVPALAMFSYLCHSLIKGLMSIMTPPDIQGSLFASIVMAQGVCEIIASFLYTKVYTCTVSFMSGFIFFVMGAFLVLSMISLVIYSVSKRSDMPDRVKERKTNHHSVA